VFKSEAVHAPRFSPPNVGYMCVQELAWQSVQQGQTNIKTNAFQKLMMPVESKVWAARPGAQQHAKQELEQVVLPKAHISSTAMIRRASFVGEPSNFG